MAENERSAGHDTDDASTAIPEGNYENTLAPDIAATEAADPGHTLAADIADSETQSIYAWSRDDDDTELAEVPERRSWKIPVAVAAVATAAAVTAAVIQLWPQRSTPSSSAAAPAPSANIAPAQISPDIQFINFVNEGLKNEPGFRGAHQGDPDAIFTGHQVCEKLSNLYPVYGPAARGQIVQFLVTNGAPTQKVAAIVESAAERAYCPQYQK